MATPTKLLVMISSRCNDAFPAAGGTTLSEIRKDLKKEIEALRIFDRPFFDVWINESADPQGGNWDSTEVCIRAVKDCDLLIAISNGNAGWASDAPEIGICHRELETGYGTAPGKVRVIALQNVKIANNAEGRRNKRFQEYVDRRSPFRGGTVTTVEDLKTRVKEAVFDGLLRLAQAGVREAGKGSYYSGEALDWTRLNFHDRAEKMRGVVRDFLSERAGSESDGGDIFAKLGGAGVLLVPHAIPAALSVSVARDMVGQPFLTDHEFAKRLTKGRCGPVHMIACQKRATEAQAMKLLGFPDATIVSAPFGIFVADNIQKVQFAFLVECHDETTTRDAVQRFFEWLAQSGEEENLAARALARSRIVQAVAKEASP